MTTLTICHKTRDQEHTQYRFEPRPSRGQPSESFTPASSLKGYLRSYLRTLTEEEKVEPKAPSGLNLEETLQVLRNTPHPQHEYPPGILEEFERLWERIDAEPLEEEDGDMETDASSNLDKYIYG